MRRLSTRLLLGATLLTLMLLVACAPAGADVFGSISLLSANSFEQAEYAHDPAISGNGSYVAFDGYLDGLTGVWRRDVQTGEVQPVAVGEPETAAGSAELPSISENGQYISFTTAAALSPKNDHNLGPDVYVRNMAVAESQPCEEEALHPAQPCAFTLASAVNGTTAGLTYKYSGKYEETFEEEHYGALAVGRSAISADGQKVVFTTTAVSDLTDPSTPEAPDTPPLQVAVRDLAAGTTQLMTVEDDPATGKPQTDEAGQPLPVAVQSEGQEERGAVYTAGGPPLFLPPPAYAPTPQTGASISADGSTVAWMGQDVAEQVRMLPHESLASTYSEPLWRRIGEGEQAPTRPVTGGADIEDPACAANPEAKLPEVASSTDPCQGPFATRGTRELGIWDGGEGDTVPRLSADGYTVAFLATAPLVAFGGSDFGASGENRKSDLYVADMHEGLSRVQALTPLTELASGEESRVSTNAGIVDFGISPDGTQVAFTTRRTVFPLGSLAYVTAPAAIPGMLELFDADLGDDTLTRVTHGYDGGASEHAHEVGKVGEEDPYPEGDGALSPSFSDNGEALVFSSTASNLVYGDGNSPPLEDPQLDGSDAFVIDRLLFATTPTPEIISAAPVEPALTPPWSLGVTALSLADGSVRLYVELPGVGTLRAAGSSPVAVTSLTTAHSHGRLVRHVRTKVLTRTVASSDQPATASSGGLTTLTLTLSSRFKALASRTGGLSATASVTFATPGHPTLHEDIEVTFLRKASAHDAKANAAHSRSKRKGKR